MCRVCFHRWRVLAATLLLLIYGGARLATAQIAYFCLEGDFENATDAVQLKYRIDTMPITNTDPFWGATYSHSGGTNAAGDTFIGGGFDPILSLYDITSGVTFLGSNDDVLWPDNLDSYLSWPDLIVSSFPVAHTYQMDLTAHQLNYPGGTSRFAMDLVSPFLPIRVTGLDTVGGAAIRKLKFGSSPFNFAGFDLIEPSITVRDHLAVGTSGFGVMWVNENTTLNTPGVTSVGYGGSGEITVESGGTWNAGLVNVGGPVGGAGTVNVTFGGQVDSGDVQVSSNAADGTVLVSAFRTSGPPIPSQWDVNGTMTIGSAAVGRASVTSELAAEINVTDNVIVQGTVDAASRLTAQSLGRVNIDGALTIEQHGTVSIQDGFLKTGSLTSTGGTLDWQNGTLEISDSGLVLDSIEPHSVFGDSLTVGADQVLIHSNPAVHFTDDHLVVGKSGAGLLTVEDGGQITSVRGLIGVSGTGTGSVSISGTGSSWTVTDQLRVGRSATGWLLIDQGGEVHADETWIGAFGTADGTITVEDSGSKLTAVTALNVGGTNAPGGSGTLTIRNGGRVDVQGILRVWEDGEVFVATGTTSGELLVDHLYLPNGGRVEVNTGGHLSAETIDFAGGQLVTTGPNSTVSVNEFINQPGNLDINGNLHIGWSAAGIGSGLGTVTIGDGQNLNVSTVVELGKNGTGTLTIENGGTATLNSIQVGSNGGMGQLVIQDAGTTLNQHGRLAVGAHEIGGTGALQILNSAVVQGTGPNSIAYIGRVAGTSGNALVSGPGALWSNLHSMYVGGNETGAGGNGTLTVHNNGLVDVNGTLKVWSNGQVLMTGGELRVGAPGMVIEQGSLVGFGEVVMSGGGQVVNQGAILPSPTAAALTITDGGYVQDSTGVFFVELGGSSPAEYSQLRILGGTATLDGLLYVDLVDLYSTGVFAPSPGDTFEILSASGGMGGSRFAHVDSPGLPAGLYWRPNYSPTAVTLEALLTGDFDFDHDLDVDDADLMVGEIVSTNNGMLFDLNSDGLVDQTDLSAWLAVAGAYNLPSGNPYLPGDANLDGRVDGSDFGFWNNNKFQFTALWTAADFNADGITDGSDFGIWNGNKFQSSDHAASVPEPFGWCGLWIALGCFFGRRRLA